MKHKIVLLFLLSLVLHQSLSAQFSSNDSLLIYRPVAESDSVHALQLAKICWESRNSNLSLSLISGRRAFEIADHHNYATIKPKICNYLGIAYRNEGNYPKAIEHFLSALKFSTETNNLIEQAYALNNVGEIYKYENNFQEAYENISAASKIFIQINDTVGIGYSFLRLGEAYLAEQKYDSAFINLQKSADYRIRQKDLRNYSVSIHRMAEVLFARHNYDGAEKLFTESLTIRNELNDLSGQAESFVSLADLYLSQKKFKQSIEAGKKGFETAKQLGQKEKLKNASTVLAKAYAAAHDYRTGYYYQTLSSGLKDSLVNSEKSLRIHSLQRNYDDERKRSEINIMKKDIEIEKEKSEQQTIYIIVSTVIVIILLVMLGFLFKLNRQRSDVNRLLETKNREINAQNEEIAQKAVSLNTAVEAAETANQKLQKANEDLIRNIEELKVTERKLLIAKEEAEKANKVKGEFISTMSHEIRTPMNAVIGMTEWLLRENPRADQLETLNILKFSAQTLLAIINDILDYSKIEVNKLELETIPFDLKALCENLLKLFKNAADVKKLKIHFSYDDQIPEKVLGDPLRIGQVITNLLSNAVKFTEHGSVHFEVQMTNEKNGECLIAFFIRDTGIGIKRDMLDYIFNVFTQASSDTTRRYGGTGLGLPIAQKLLSMMGSTISVDSQPGQGSRFSFYLKLRKSDDEKAPVKKTTEQKIKTSGHHHILLVEDNEINVKVTGKFLSRWEISYDVAVNGMLAVELFEKNTYDLILMDLQMPVMDGYSATKLIREKNNGIPIIAVTAESILPDNTSFSENGWNDMIIKPFDPDILHNKIHTLLNKSKAV